MGPSNLIRGPILLEKKYILCYNIFDYVFTLGKSDSGLTQRVGVEPWPFETMLFGIICPTKVCVYYLLIFFP